MNLKNRRAVITGAAGGLGRVLADTLAELGADLVLVDKQGQDLGELKSNLCHRWGVNVQMCYCDLEQQNERIELIALLRKQPLHILINNAAFVGTAELTGWSVPFEDQTVSAWRRALEVNLIAVFELCQGLTPLLKEAVGASIVNIGSIYGEYGPDWCLYEDTNMSNPAAYGASKSGVLQFTRWLATTISPKVRVNAISPGGIFRNQSETFVQKYEAKTPLKRMGCEDDFRGAIAYLASDLSKYVTGHNLMVDGGWGIW